MGSTPHEHLLQNILIMTELGMDLRDRCVTAAKYLTNLKNLLNQATYDITTLEATAKFALQKAKHMLNEASTLPHRRDYDKLLGIIERQLSELGDGCDETERFDYAYISERIKFLEKKHSVQDSGSNRSVKADVDEKYPDNWNRDSCIDFHAITNLPPVPEDAFSSFNPGNKPRRSSSLSSLKGIRKVKLFLQRAESEEEEVSSEEDRESPQKGDSDEGGSPKKLLGNIREEPQY